MEKMKHLSNWAKGKPLGLVMIAQQLAVGAESCFESLMLIKSGDRIEAFSSLPKAREWVRLYRSHRRMQRSITECLRRFGKNGRMWAEFAEVIFLRQKTLSKTLESMKKEFETMRPFERRRVISKGQKEVNRLYSLHLADIESDIDGKVNEEFNRKFKEALNEPEIKFFFKAWIPCWFLYGDYAPRLLRRARLGDVKTTEKLLRLDPSIINDPKIGEYLHQARGKGKGASFERLMEASLKEPKAKMTVKKVKCSIAGFISLASIMLGWKLEEPEVRKLFDAVAHDMGKGDIDTDLPESPEAFEKAIRRERAFWMPTIRPDKK